MHEQARTAGAVLVITIPSFNHFTRIKTVCGLKLSHGKVGR